MSKPTLTYFDFPGGRGEDCRLALHIAGIDFTDDRVKGAAWSGRKSATPYGALPVLSIPGRGEIGESNAILAFIGRNHDLHPTDGWQAAQHEAIMSVAEDLRARITATGSDDADAKKLAREALADGYLQHWAANVQKQIATGPFLAGDTLNVADLKLFVLMRWFISGGLDHISPDCFLGHSKLMAHYEAVQDHPGVVSWYARDV